MDMPPSLESFQNKLADTTLNLENVKKNPLDMPLNLENSQNKLMDSPLSLESFQKKLMDTASSLANFQNKYMSSPSDLHSFQKKLINVDSPSDLESFQKKLMDTPSTSQDFPTASSATPIDGKGDAMDSNKEDKDNTNPVDDQVKGVTQNAENEDKLTDKEKDRLKDLKKIREIKLMGCGCSLKCDEQFTEELILNYIQDIREMERAHRDMIIMNCINEVGDSFATKKGKKRQRQTYIYTLEGRRVCRTIFMLVFDIGKKRLKNLKHHYAEFGVVPRIHGNFGKKPVNALQSDDIRNALQFILNFVDEFGMPQPGAPGLSDLPPPTFLPNDCSRKQIHDKYLICCGLANIREIKYSSFGNVWRTLTPYLRMSNNKEEMCVVCEDLKKTIKESTSDEYKSESEEELRQHVALAQKGGELYNACIAEAQKTHKADAYEKYVHYTFGFCKNVGLPHRSSQIGPVYFTALRKVQMFGFRIDGWQQQLTFLIDENESIGPDGSEVNGPNSIISMIDWALERYSGDEKKCSFHGDNSLDQNKLWYLVAYFMWRVMTMKHEQIELMLQVPGHVHSLVETSFGSIRQMYRNSDCEVVEQLESLVSSATPANEVIRYPAWKWRDWEAFLSPVFKELQDARQYQYFRFSSAEPGFVMTRNGKDEHKINILLKEDYHLGIKIPTELKPAGLTQDRMVYLYNKVRPFVHPSFQDRLCPEPPSQEA